MGLETVVFISDLVPTNPTGSDPKSHGDDHLRKIKTGVKNTFPNITGAVTASHTELNFMDGATTQPAMKDGSNLTTPTAGDNSTKIATTAFVAATAFSSALPAQVDGVLQSDGTTASFSPLLRSSVRVVDSTDNSKRVAFALAGLTAGSTRTLTIPDRDITLGGFANMLVISGTQTWTPPAGITRAKVTIQDGGDAGGGNGGSKGGNASISIVAVNPAVTYTAAVGGFGVAPSGLGGASSFSGTGLTTRTSSAGDLLLPGGQGPVSQVNAGFNSYLGGASHLAECSSTAGTGPGGGGANVNGGTSYNGAAGAVIIEF